MATFHYLSAGEAWSSAQDSAPDYQKIVGLRAVDADKIQGTYRTRAGYAKAPADTWAARAFLDRFKVVERIEWCRNLGEDADPGMVEIFWADGTSDYLGPKDLLCVERPVKGA